MTSTTPTRSSHHDALNVFVGQWRAEGTSYGGTDQSGDPKANGEPWVSTHETRWHTGSFFLIDDERAKIAGRPFDTHAVLGIDAETGEYFVRTFENHGYYRDYRLNVDGRTWSLSGESERARIEFSPDGRTQMITWEWKRGGKWLPLCDRTATKID